MAQLTNDAQLREDAALMRRYMNTLSDAIYEQTGRQMQQQPFSDTSAGTRPYREADSNGSDLPEVELDQ